MSADQDQAEASALHDAVERAGRDNDRPGAVLVRWVLVADWINVEGERSLRTIGSDGMTPWEAEGMLRMAPVPEVEEE